MIISYDKNSSLSVDEKLKSLVDNIQIALDETPGSTAQSIDEAKIMAERAHSAAAEAAETAGTAQTTAESAQSAAESAQSAAGNASNAATEAQSKAEAAQSAASTASSTATEAKTTAESAQSTAEAAQTAAGNAQSTAESAQSTASTAQAAAEAAGKTATDYIKENDDGTINIENKSSSSTAKAVVNESSFDIVDEGTTVASFGEVSRIGTEGERHIEMASNGFEVLSGNAVIAHVGYGEVETSNGSGIGAFYTFGIRMAGKPIGKNSFAQGRIVSATDDEAHAEGYGTTASNYCAHAEGQGTIASGTISHAEGYFSQSSGIFSHAQNKRTIANGMAQTAIGKNNIEHGDDIAFIIGNGSDEVRSDALTVGFNGKLTLAGHSSSVGSAATPYNGSANNGNTISTTGSWQALKSSVTLDKGTWVITASARFKDSATVGGSTANTTAGNRFLAITVGGSRHDASVTGGYIAAKQAARYSTSLAVVIDEDGTSVSMAVNTSTAVGVDMQNIEAIRIA